MKARSESDDESRQLVVSPLIARDFEVFLEKGVNRWFAQIDTIDNRSVDWQRKDENIVL